MKYDIINAGDLPALIERTQDRLDEGWTVLGGPMIFKSPKGNWTVYYQAVTKTQSNPLKEDYSKRK